MSKKRSTLGKARKIKQLTNYIGDVGVYELQKGVRKPFKTEFLLIASTRPISGPAGIAMWVCDEHGVVEVPKPRHTFQSLELSQALNEIGYTLIP